MVALRALCLTASLCLTLAAVGENSVTVVDRPALIRQSSINNYPRYRVPLHGGYLLKLPVGQVQPKGWLREFLLRQRAGLNGQLGTVSAWLEKSNNQWLSDSGDHGWEEVPYWLRGYASLAYILDDEEMKREAQVWFEGVLTHLKADGFLGPKNTSNGRPEVWAQMIMLWALQTYYEYSGDTRVIDAMTNYFKWELTVPDDLFLEDYWENKRGGDNEWSVIWLYNRTGDEALLPLIQKLHANTANWMMKDDLPNWHGVNVAQGFREPATYYVYTGEEQALQCAYDNHRWMRECYGQVPGGMYGADENARAGYTDPRQGAETCAIVEQMASDEILMGITGDPAWADHCEDVAFNTLPAALTPDMRALRYITSPNMAVSDGKNHAPSIDNNLRGMLSMSPFSSRCCQHNHGMGWPYFAEHLVMATTDNGLATMLYAANETTALVADGKTVRLIEDTNYPFEEEIRLTIHTEAPVTFPLYLRIPAWAKDASLTINGEAQPVTVRCSAQPITVSNGSKSVTVPEGSPEGLGSQPVTVSNGSKSVTVSNGSKSVTVPEGSPEGLYFRVNRMWQEGDKVVLQLPMTFSRQVWLKNKSSVSVNYGPLTLSLRIGEEYRQRDSRDHEIVQDDSHWQTGVDASLWPAYEIFATTDWNYALCVDANDMPLDLTIQRKAWPADNFPFTPESVPFEVTAKGRKIPSWGFDATGMTAPLPTAFDAHDSKEQPLTLIPMGATRLRITAFPHTRLTH